MLGLDNSALILTTFDIRYEKRKRRDGSHAAAYHFIGYASLYPFYYYPEKVRMRLRLVDAPPHNPFILS